jgi:hypothetical protein
LRTKVKSRESSWRAINEEAEAIEVLSSRPAGKLVVCVVDMDVFAVLVVEAKVSIYFRIARPP